jgi:hypothetical protein
VPSPLPFPRSPIPGIDTSPFGNKRIVPSPLPFPRSPLPGADPFGKSQIPEIDLPRFPVPRLDSLPSFRDDFSVWSNGATLSPP